MVLYLKSSSAASFNGLHLSTCRLVYEKGRGCRCGVATVAISSRKSGGCKGGWAPCTRGDRCEAVFMTADPRPPERVLYSTYCAAYMHYVLLQNSVSVWFCRTVAGFCESMGGQLDGVCTLQSALPYVMRPICQLI
jgi:hypothetical protein